MENEEPLSSRVPALLSMVLPAGVFYLLLHNSAVELPIADDYHAVLAFLNGLVAADGWSSKLLHILTFQHNEYKLIFESGVIATQYALLGHASFDVLNAVGNGFVILLFLVLVAMCRFPSRGKLDNFLLFLPVSLLLFQLQYASTLNWAMGSLQNMPVLFFALGSLLLLSAESKVAFTAALVSMLLAIASSGNGFVVAPVGGLMLFQQRRWKAMPVWIAVFLAAAGGYFYRYDFLSAQSPEGRSVTHAIARLNPAYALTFMGSSVALSQAYWLSLFFGVVLCGVVVLAIKKEYYRHNPAVFYSLIFLVLTAVGVSGMRSGFGIAQSLASRYRIYSDLFLIFAYMFLSEVYFETLARTRAGKRLILLVLILVCGAFCGLSDRAGFRYLAGRRLIVLNEMAEWQHPSAVKASYGAGADAVMLRHIEAGIYKPDGPVLTKSIALGVYRPPVISATP